MRFTVLTLHPDLVKVPLATSIIGRAVEDDLIVVDVVDIRDHGIGKHRSVDDAPYGGGAGMVMRVDVVADALDAVRSPDSHVVLTSAAGRPFDQAAAQRLSALGHVVVLCGHYEGIDARIEALVDEEISLGDFVMTGGEIAALAIVDATARLVPGVLGNAHSAVDESFSTGLLEYPQYTRPRVWRDREVPDVLLSGHHAKVKAWRHEQSLVRTASRRPDLVTDAVLAGRVDGRRDDR